MKGASPYTQDETGRTALHQAAVNGDDDAVTDMLESGADPNTQDAHLQTPITLAAELGLYPVVKALAAHAATNINLQDSFGRTPLHWCAKRCDVLGVEVLLNTGKANINMRTGGGDTALHWACSQDEGTFSVEGFGDQISGNFQELSLKVTELLLGAGADVYAKNAAELRPLDVASGDGVRVLLSSAMQALEQQEEREAAEDERHRESLAAAKRPDSSADRTETKSNGVDAPSKEKHKSVPTVEMTKGWGKSTGFGVTGLGASKSSSSGATVVGTKKKIVIKLKKKP